MIAVNKLDHPAAKTMVADLRWILRPRPRAQLEESPIVLTEALREEGVEALWDRLGEHRSHLESDGLLDERRRERLRGGGLRRVIVRAKAHLQRTVHDDPELAARARGRAGRRELDPLSASTRSSRRSSRLTLPTAADVERARERLASVARVTPTVRSATLSRPGRDVWLKAENLGFTGSFEVREPSIAWRR